MNEVPKRSTDDPERLDLARLLAEWYTSQRGSAIRQEEDAAAIDREDGTMGGGAGKLSSGIV